MRYEYALRTLAGMSNPYEVAKHRHFAGIWNGAFREAQAKDALSRALAAHSPYPTQSTRCDSCGSSEWMRIRGQTHCAYCRSLPA